MRELSGLEIEPLCAYLEACDAPFQPSQLYSAAEDAKFVDTSLRLSEYRALTDERLFDIAEALVGKISAQDPGCDYTLVRNDVTHIRYLEGGFFSRHQDFLSLASNMVEEYTLLVCVTPPALAAATQGGETVVHIGGQATPHTVTTTPGSALLFRKDVEHEGAKVTAGEKHVVSLNLWAVRKRSEQVLLVSFPTAEGDEPAGSEAVGAAALLAEANARKYALSSSDLAPGTMLAAQVEWANNAADATGAARPVIVRYEAPCTYDDFDVIFRICRSMHLEAEELIDRAHVIDYFFPSFDRRTVLVDFAATPTATAAEAGQAEGAAAASAKTAPRADEQSAALAAAARVAAEKSARAAAECEVDDEVICCESDERTAVVAELARTLDLPYVRFRMVFVEGIVIFNYGGDMSKEKVPVLPAWVSLGDYDNILLYRKVAYKGDTVPASLADLDKLCNIWTAYPELLELAEKQPAHSASSFLRDQIDSWAPEGDLQERNGQRHPEVAAAFSSPESRSGCKLASSVVCGLRVALPPGGESERLGPLTGLLFEERVHIMDMDLVHLPDGIGRRGMPRPSGEPSAATTSDVAPKDAADGEGEDRPEGEPAEGQATPPPPPVARRQGSARPAWLFHRDMHGCSCFTADEARQATERVLALELDERVKACLQRKKFVLPQHAHSFNSHFCNESVYGTMNLLSVSGIVRLEAAPVAARTQLAPVFDAWPPPEVLRDKRHRDFETRPRRWFDEGDGSESDPSNAPSSDEGEDDAADGGD